MPACVDLSVMRVGLSIHRSLCSICWPLPYEFHFNFSTSKHVRGFPWWKNARTVIPEWDLDEAALKDTALAGAPIKICTGLRQSLWVEWKYGRALGSCWSIIFISLHLSLFGFVPDEGILGPLAFAMLGAWLSQKYCLLFISWQRVWAPRFRLSPNATKSWVWWRYAFGPAVLAEPSSPFSPSLHVWNMSHSICDSVHVGLIWSRHSCCAISKFLVLRFLYISTNFHNLYSVIDVLKRSLGMQTYTLEYRME